MYPWHDTFHMGVIHFMAYPEATTQEKVVETVKNILKDEFFQAIEISALLPNETLGLIGKMCEVSKMELLLAGQPLILSHKLNLNALDEATGMYLSIVVPVYNEVDSLPLLHQALQTALKNVNFTWEEFVRRNNEELVATWGNLANRVLGFAYKRFDGRVPQPGEFDAADRALLDQIAPTFERVTAQLDAVKLKQALDAAMGLAHEANRYQNLKEPWHQIKTDPAAAAAS
ncbi:MAG: class I tRNA ligase family protein, partial [Atribacterota bacterium]